MTGLIIALVAGLITTTTAQPLLRALPTPAGQDSSPYRPLASWRTSWWMGAVVAFLTWLVLLQPAAVWPAGLVLATIGGFAACVDELVCWLPKYLTHAATALTITALAGTCLAGLTTPQVLVRSLLAGVAVRTFFWLIWRLVGTMGFGDVRLSLLCGLAAGQVSWQAVYLAALLGTLLPLVEALATHRGQKMIPYGPGLLLGCLTAVAAVAH